MTQQYIVGEFSALLAGLQPPPCEPLAAAVRGLRHQIEYSQQRLLPLLAQEALDLADEVCLAALDHGDTDAFTRSLGATIALQEFSVGAGLLP